MVRNLIRLAVFSAISLKISQYIVTAYSFSHPSSILLLITGMSILYYFVKPLLRMVSLPDSGPGYIFLTFVLTLITIQALTLFIPFFDLRPTTISELIIFGFMLPSKRLNAFWANVFSSLLIAVLMAFFNWLYEGKKR